jgi:polyisoprenoid-binding protein YceI
MPRDRMLGVLLLVGVWLAGAARGARAESQRYVLDASASHVAIHVGKAGLLSFAGHEHEVVAPALRGRMSVDPGRLDDAAVEVDFDAAALRVTGAGEPAGDVAEVQRTMLGPECLDVARFPTIRFVSTAVTPAGDPEDRGHLAIRGNLTLHGVTRAIVVPARVDFHGDTVEATGTLTVRQTDFGIQPISKAGVVNVKNELDVRWKLVARRR